MLTRELGNKESSSPLALLCRRGEGATPWPFRGEGLSPPIAPIAEPAMYAPAADEKGARRGLYLDLELEARGKSSS